MKNSKMSSSSNERRNFFRLSNKVFLGYRKAAEEEVKQFLQNEEHIKTDSIDMSHLLDQISRQMTPTLINIRQESSAIAQYLDLLNQKVDLIASMVSFQQFRLDTEQGMLESTETLDISEGGFSFKSTHQIPENDHIFCRIAIMGYRLGMETFGKVVRCSPVKQQTGQYCIAVELPYLKELDKKNLTRFIFDKQREQLRNRVDD